MSDIAERAFRELWIEAQIIADAAQDEGDRVYFGSSNQLDRLREVLQRYRFEPTVSAIVYSGTD